MTLGTLGGGVSKGDIFGHERGGGGQNRVFSGDVICGQPLKYFDTSMSIKLLLKVTFDF